MIQFHLLLTRKSVPVKFSIESEVYPKSSAKMKLNQINCILQEFLESMKD